MKKRNTQKKYNGHNISVRLTPELEGKLSRIYKKQVEEYSEFIGRPSISKVVRWALEGLPDPATTGTPKPSE